jgi:hypothetical protein
MKKKILIAILLLCAGMAFFLTRNKEHSDVVIVYERDAPSGPVSEAGPVPTPMPSRSADVSPTPIPSSVIPGADPKIQEELKEVLNDLPTMEEIKDLPEAELHHTPHAIKDGGLKIGKVISEADTTPSRRGDTADFLIKCAEKESLMPAIRAVCWHQLMKKVPEWKIFVPVSDARVPDDIKRLSTQL